MSNKVYSLAVAALFALMIVGCSSQQVTTPDKKAPEWVTGKLPGAPDAIYARGQGNMGANPVMARKRAEDDARQELGRTIESRVKNMMDQFVNDHQDFINTSNSASTSFSKSVSRSVSQATLVGSQIEEVWDDAGNKIIHALAIIRKTDLVNQIKAKAKDESPNALTEKKADEALKMLDKELEKWDLTK